MATNLVQFLTDFVLSVDFLFGVLSAEQFIRLK